MKNKKGKIDPISLFSHELKTPLSSLRLGLSLLEKNTGKKEDVLPLLKEEVENMIYFVTNYLDLRFIQERKDLFEWEWKDFPPLLSQSLSSLKLLAQKKSVSFHIKKEGQSPAFELYMDSFWISHLLKNLLSNALRFSPKGGRVFIEYGISDKKIFFCSVRDEGMGLSDDQPVFDLFYKKSESSQEGEALKSSGLGLCIAKSIVSAHKGSIQAFSNKNSPGATFYFEIPQFRFIKKSA